MYNKRGNRIFARITSYVASSLGLDHLYCYRVDYSWRVDYFYANPRIRWSATDVGTFHERRQRNRSRRFHLLLTAALRPRQETLLLHRCLHLAVVLETATLSYRLTRLFQRSVNEVGDEVKMGLKEG